MISPPTAGLTVFIPDVTLKLDCVSTDYVLLRTLSRARNHHVISGRNQAVPL